MTAERKTYESLQELDMHLRLTLYLNTNAVLTDTCVSSIGQSRKVQCQVLGNIEKYRYVFEQVTDAESSISVPVDSKRFGKQTMVNYLQLQLGSKPVCFFVFFEYSSFPARLRFEWAGLPAGTRNSSGGCGNAVYGSGGGSSRLFSRSAYAAEFM